MADFIVVGIVTVILFLAIRYILKAKKRGVKCIGCPDGCSCQSKCENPSGCGRETV